MGNDKATLGKASLWSAIIGVVLPGGLAVLAAIFLNSTDARERAYAICAVLSVVLELIAFGCGIAARRTATGKAAVAISVILLVVDIFAVLG
jgi:heme/copper-type cytochrome/quinol oxidase subunit 4